MKKEGISVSDYYDSAKTYDVFFRRNNRGTIPQGKLRFYYSQDTNITIGTIFVLKGIPYLVISQDGIESDVYYTSMAVKCDTTFSVWSNTERKYFDVPCAVISDKYTLSHNSTISIVSGSVTVYTGLNDYSMNMEINDAYYNFGGYYKVANVFYNNGLAYVYMTREAMPSKDTYSLTYNGLTSLDMSDVTTYQLSYIARKNDMIVENPALSYSCNNNEIVSISETGLLTMLGAGVVTITATWTDGDNTTCLTTIVISNGGDAPDPTVGELTITGRNDLRVGYSRTYTAHYTDSSGNDVSDTMTSVWSISDCSFEDTIIRSNEENNQITVSVGDDETHVGETFTLNVVDTEGLYAPASIQVNIIWGW